MTKRDAALVSATLLIVVILYGIATSFSTGYLCSLAGEVVEHCLACARKAVFSAVAPRTSQSKVENSTPVPLLENEMRTKMSPAITKAVASCI
eukprot:5519518-Amphidinium_carterae.1